MTPWSNVPLQSIDLAKYAVQVECYVCDGGNRYDAEFCRHCRAPLTLAFQSQKQKSRPQLLAILGGPKAGKTCYVGMLTDMLSRQPSGLQMFAHGAFSVSLQQQTISALAGRRFPPSTPISPEGWRWIHCDVRETGRKRGAELVIPDISGTAIIDELDTPQRVPAVRQLFGKSAAAMILVEAQTYQDDQHKPEFVALKIVSELLRLQPPKKRKGWSQKPIAIVFTKADQCDVAFDSPDEYARRHTPSLWRLCHDQLGKHQFFAASVATVHTGIDGFGDPLPIPMRVEPRGIVPPFAWVTQQLRG
jgi:hypothetical protein